jgi:glutamyl-tRNA synthetase
VNVRTRYAPSPTGEPHVGNIRTALFSWLLARHHGGQFLLRVEDTDQNRLVPGSVELMMEALRWLGLDWDEGPDVGGPKAPYVQSERLGLYKREAARLVQQRDAYECFCTPERLDEMRKAQQAAKLPPKYDGLCRRLDPAGRSARAAAGEQHVIRFAMPESGETVLHDLIRGDISFQNELVGDFVLLKSDGFPTYHLAAMVDDHEMEISHVLRGEEWISSAPGHLRLFEALGFEPPLYGHLPLILGKDRSKLSKRHGAVSVLAYRDQGYLPEALFNFLGLLGWSLDDSTTVISREQFIDHFDVTRIVSNPAIWDTDKLDWLNGHYIREMPADEFGRVLEEQLERDLPPDVPRPLDPPVAKVAPLVQERIKLLSEAAPLTQFFWAEVHPTLDQLLGKRFKEEPGTAKALLEKSLQALDGVEWRHDALEAALRALAEQENVKPRDLFGLLRVAVTGAEVSPPLFESMEVLGRQKSVFRLGQAVLTVG